MAGTANTVEVTWAWVTFLDFGEADHTYKANRHPKSLLHSLRRQLNALGGSLTDLNVTRYLVVGLEKHYHPVEILMDKNLKSMHKATLLRQFRIMIRHVHKQNPNMYKIKGAMATVNAEEKAP